MVKVFNMFNEGNNMKKLIYKLQKNIFERFLAKNSLDKQATFYE